MKKSVHSVGDLVGRPNPKGNMANNQYVGRLLYDERWGFGIVTIRKANSFFVWWYNSRLGRDAFYTADGNDWHGEVDKYYVCQNDARKLL
jgi:hypothetical protein